MRAAASLCETHEFLDDTMKDDTVVVTVLRVLHKILDRLGRIFGV